MQYPRDSFLQQIAYSGIWLLIFFSPLVLLGAGVIGAVLADRIGKPIGGGRRAVMIIFLVSGFSLSFFGFGYSFSVT